LKLDTNGKLTTQLYVKGDNRQISFPAAIFKFHLLKGIGSILFLKNVLKKICRKNYKNHLRSNNYEVCTAVALCCPNILDVMVLENINLSSDKNRATVIVI
jgi:hypothetical protein